MSDLIELKDKTLIDLLLEEQQTLDTPVGRFADEAEVKTNGQGTHSDLIPLTAPKSGEQYAFQVNLDLCSGCKGCVTACHSLNGLDENETWRDVGLLVGGKNSVAYQQTVTTACHHCVDPACMNGCPVNAYEKDPVSGVVLHLDDQCIGCQYCVLKCPYDVPKYSSKRGIVRKCDMCHSRLSSGEAPACVQACPHEAIKIVTVDKEAIVAESSEQKNFLPDSPDPAYTQPTTRYVSKKEIPGDMVAADSHVLRPQHTHWPLVGLLALSQIGIGGHLAAAVFWTSLGEVAQSLALGGSWAILHAGLVCSALHLGQPLKAWRIFLGFRRSWLSREALVLGACSGASSTALGLHLVDKLGISIPFVEPQALLGPVLWATPVIGLIGVFTSVYIYVDTQRSFWKLPYSAGKFYGSTLLGFLSFGLLAQAQGNVIYGLGLAIVVGAKLFLEWNAKNSNPQSKGILNQPLRSLWISRLAVGVGLAAAAPLAAYFAGGWVAWSVLTVGVLASELLERVVYFRAVNAPKMPGGLNA